MNKRINKQITIVTACRNREGNLGQAIQSWLAISPCKVIVCDWGSAIPLTHERLGIEECKHIVDILRYEADRWILTWAFNEALMQVKSEYVLKLDCDHVVSNDFAELNQPCFGHFSRGHWRQAEEGQQYINGAFLSCTDLLRRVGYYDERITTYGWDDSDLYTRLYDAGLGSSVFAKGSLRHLDQCETTRTKEQEVSKEGALASHLGIEKTAFLINRNRILCGMLWPWDSNMLKSREQIRVRFVAPEPEEEALIEHATLKAFEMHYQWKGLFGKTGIPAGEAYQQTLFAFSQCLSNRPSSLNIAQLLKRYSDACRSKNEFEMNLVKLALLSNSPNTRFHSRLKAIDRVDAIHANDKMDASQKTVNEISNKRTTGLIIKRTKFYIDAQHGLGNRLRAIGSASAIADRTDRELVIVWTPDSHCQCYFTDLFSYNGSIISQTFHVEPSKHSAFNYMEAEGGSKNTPINCDINQDIYVRSAFVLSSPYSEWSSENEFIQNLKPVEEVKALVASVRNPNDVSVHIRMEGGFKDETLPYESPHNWSEEDHKAIDFWRGQSHFSRFMTCIDRMLAEGEINTIFLAADKAEVYKQFAAKYHDKVSWLNRNIYDRSMMQLRFALADAILLSRSKLLFGSTWSSFTELAQRLAVESLSVKMSGKDF